MSSTDLIYFKSVRTVLCPGGDGYTGLVVFAYIGTLLQKGEIVSLNAYAQSRFQSPVGLW
jgi:hypothetical protein